MHLYIQVFFIFFIVFLVFLLIYKYFKSKNKNDLHLIYKDNVETVEFKERVRPSAKKIHDNFPIGAIHQINPINTYLKSVENNAIVYEVFTNYYSSVQEMTEDTSNRSKDAVTVFNNGSSHDRLLKAEKCFKITRENIVFRKAILGNEQPKYFKIFLVAIKKNNGEEKREVLKMVNSN